jgi:guanylate kinase
MKKILFLIGPDKSGKTYLQNKLLENYPDEFVKILSSTTRGMREGEEDGVDYNFHTKEQFVKLKEDGKLFQHVKYGENFYFTRIKDYDQPGKIGVFVCTPEGVNDTLNAAKENNMDMTLEICFFAVTDKLLESRGFDERTSRGDIRKSFYEKYSTGEFSHIKNIKFIKDHEVNDYLHEKIRAKATESYQLQSRASDILLGALSRGDKRYCFNKGGSSFIKWNLVHKDIESIEDFYIEALLDKNQEAA